MASTYSLHTARNIIQQKVKESDLKDVIFGTSEAFNIFTASKEQDRNLDNIHAQHEDNCDSQVETLYMSS